MSTGTCHPFFSYFSSASVRSGLCLLRVLLIIELEGREASRNENRWIDLLYTLLFRLYIQEIYS